jgi:hypothetical protein
MTPEASLPADFHIHNHITPFTRRLCAAAPESVLAVRPEDLVEDVFPYIQDPGPLNVPTNAFLLITGLYLPSAGITAATKTIRGTSVIAVRSIPFASASRWKALSLSSLYPPGLVPKEFQEDRPGIRLHRVHIEKKDMLSSSGKVSGRRGILT